ncbi:LuxR family transcriptional regulator [Burkholderiaceae bacterium 16]|nr:LuxR family transcriptional regulator [Burkholderiaceae bacterium 16]
MHEHATNSRAADQSPGLAIEAVASTKLVPPRATRRLISRDALQQRLLDARRQRCIVLQGPAGSGKTCSLVALRQALLTLDFDVAWLSLAAEDNELTRFFSCLLAGIGMVDGEVVRDAALLMRRDSDGADFEHWVVSLVEALAARQRDLTVIVDDLQYLNSPQICQALQCLLDYAPPNLHLVFSSRSAFPLSLARLRAQSLVVEFDLHDLRFTPEESERFLREQLGHIDRRDARVLHDLTDGWVAGLQLFAVDMHAKPGGGYARVRVRDAKAFASYFEREVLDNLRPEDLQLLTIAATCSQFCASLCATLLGVPQAVAAMTSRLTRLDDHNLFISQVRSQDRETWYRVHPLLREVLSHRLDEMPLADRLALHGAAWRWFGARGHIDDAVRHAVQAGEVQAAADIVEACAVEMMGRGELSEVSSLVRRLPAEQVQARFPLRLVTAYLAMYAGNLGAVDAALRRFESDLDALGVGERFAVRVLQAALALQRDDSESIHAIAPLLEAIPDDAQAFAFAGRAHLLAWMHMHHGHYDAARALLQEGAERNVAPARRMTGQALSGMSLSLEGRIVEAERALRAVQHEVGRHDTLYIDVGAVVDGMLGEVIYELNELNAVCTQLEPCLDMVERTSVPDAALRGFLAVAAAHWRLGHRLEALEQLDRLDDYASRRGLDRMQAHALALRLRMLLEQGATTEAIEVLESLTALGRQYATAARGTGAEIRRVADAARAAADLHWEDYDGAIACLKPLLEDARAAGRGAAVAAAHAALAVAYHGRGDADAARRQLLEALRLGHQLGLMRSLLDVSDQIPAMLEAQAPDALDPVLAFYAKRLVAAAASTREAAAQPALRDAGGTTDVLNVREREVLALVAQAMPNKKIARVLGVTSHTVKWHLRKIYSKLGVSERDEAVARMRDLEMDSASRPH